MFVFSSKLGFTIYRLLVELREKLCLEKILFINILVKMFINRVFQPNLSFNLTTVPLCIQSNHRYYQMDYKETVLFVSWLFSVLLWSSSLESARMLFKFSIKLFLIIINLDFFQFDMLLTLVTVVDGDVVVVVVVATG